MLNTAVFAPMPIASVRITTAVNEGARRSAREACLASRASSSSQRRPR